MDGRDRLISAHLYCAGPKARRVVRRQMGRLRRVVAVVDRLRVGCLADHNSALLVFPSQMGTPIATKNFLRRHICPAAVRAGIMKAKACRMISAFFLFKSLNA